MQTLVNNHDVKGLDDRIGRFITEVFKGTSSNVSELFEADKERLRTYLASVRKYIKWVTDQETLDLPETTPTAFELDAINVFQEVENEMVNDIGRLLITLRGEVRNSQSATRGNGYISHDVRRWEAIVNKIESYLDTYVEDVSPLDLPESSPMNAGVQAGEQGVHGNRVIAGE